MPDKLTAVHLYCRGVTELRWSIPAEWTVLGHTWSRRYLAALLGFTVNRKHVFLRVGVGVFHRGAAPRDKTRAVRSVRWCDKQRTERRPQFPRRTDGPHVLQISGRKSGAVGPALFRCCYYRSGTDRRLVPPAGHNSAYSSDCNHLSVPGEVFNQSNLMKEILEWWRPREVHSGK